MDRIGEGFGTPGIAGSIVSDADVLGPSRARIRPRPAPYGSRKATADPSLAEGLRTVTRSGTHMRSDRPSDRRLLSVSVVTDRDGTTTYADHNPVCPTTDQPKGPTMTAKDIKPSNPDAEVKKTDADAEESRTTDRKTNKANVRI